ncbi:MAG: GNAT family N-acetyltransferase [Candidatus Eremiobacteraeota bacterium]|nr:GNAT family N-acetyltransferase [Candidatus Eremiobacteraeota bacterium]
MRPIRTERLRLTPVSVQNAAALWGLLQAPGLREFQDLPNVGSAAFSTMVGKRPKRLRVGISGRFEWLMYMHRMRRALGWISLRIMDREPRIGEIGYSVIGEFRGRGLATEAVRALIEEAFEQAELDRISAYCVPENVASRRILENLGFRDAGLVHHGASVGGRPVDVLHHVMRRNEFDQSAKTIDISASA